MTCEEIREFRAICDRCGHLEFFKSSETFVKLPEGWDEHAWIGSSTTDYGHLCPKCVAQDEEYARAEEEALESTRHIHG